jgi:hypothetical protein
MSYGVELLLEFMKCCSKGKELTDIPEGMATEGGDVNNLKIAAGSSSK